MFNLQIYISNLLSMILFFCFLLFQNSLNLDYPPLKPSQLEEILYSQHMFSENNKLVYFLVEIVDLNGFRVQKPSENITDALFKSSQYIIAASCFTDVSLSLKDDFSPTKSFYRNRTIVARMSPALVNSNLGIKTDCSLLDYLERLQDKLTGLIGDLSGKNDFEDPHEPKKMAALKLLEKMLSSFEYDDSDKETNLHFSKETKHGAISKLYTVTAPLTKLGLLQERVANLENYEREDKSSVHYNFSETVVLKFGDENVVSIQEILTLLATNPQEAKKSKYVLLTSVPMKEFLDEITIKLINKDSWIKALTFPALLYAGLILLTVILVLLKI